MNYYQIDVKTKGFRPKGKKLLENLKHYTHRKVIPIEGKFEYMGFDFIIHTTYKNGKRLWIVSECTSGAMASSYTKKYIGHNNKAEAVKQLKSNIMHGIANGMDLEEKLAEFIKYRISKRSTYVELKKIGL